MKISHYMEINEIVADTLLKTILIVLEEECEVTEGFDIIWNTQSLDQNSVKVEGRFVSQKTYTPNYIDGFIESYDSDDVWEDFSFILSDVANTKESYKNVKSKLYEYTGIFNVNLRSKYS